MYICQDCKKTFEKVRTDFERHNLDAPPYEGAKICPNCKSGGIIEQEKRYCRCCGARLAQGVYGYCNLACRKKGERMWEAQAKRQLLNTINPLLRLVKGVDLYNAEHGTSYSYGQFTAIILPRLSKKEAKRYI